MNTLAEKIDTIKKAKGIIESRLDSAPDFDIFRSIASQLNYLLDLLENRTSDRSRLADINVGSYAVHEFEESDPELAQELKNVQFIVYKMTKGAGRI